ncbi:hypothetical protein Pmani_023130 [Petrolisthes manimaculis]|uniref:Uncharacterized protein n=1 Tax=Petrolisthes manimaculis TaxID=1843537 RepID=A0AAE1PBN7_9EUCA|nr:hypothetical protein Pmani_023130 [Petrolisthes manimaculis]
MEEPLQRKKEKGDIYDVAGTLETVGRRVLNTTKPPSNSDTFTVSCWYAFRPTPNSEPNFTKPPPLYYNIFTLSTPLLYNTTYSTSLLHLSTTTPPTSPPPAHPFHHTWE